LNFALKLAQNIPMAAAEAQLPAITVPAALLAEVKELARVQEKSVDQVLLDAVNSYVARAERWERIHAYGKAQAQKLGYTEADVERLIAEVRQEHGEDAA
jgi:hypothetical protein